MLTAPPTVLEGIVTILQERVKEQERQERQSKLKQKLGAMQ